MFFGEIEFYAILLYSETNEKSNLKKFLLAVKNVYKSFPGFAEK